MAIIKTTLMFQSTYTLYHWSTTLKQAKADIQKLN